CTGKPLAKVDASAAAPRPIATPAALPGGRETRLVGLLCVEVCEAEGERVQGETLLALIAAKVQGAGGRIEATKHSQLVATFGVYPCEDPARLAAHTAVTVSKTGAPGGASTLKSPTVRIAIHVCETPVRRINRSF